MRKSGLDEEKESILSVLIGTDPDAGFVRVIDGFSHPRLCCSLISPRGSEQSSDAIQDGTAELTLPSD